MELSDEVKRKINKTGQAKRNLGLIQVVVWVPQGAAYKTSIKDSAEKLCTRFYQERMENDPVTRSLDTPERISFLIDKNMEQSLIESTAREMRGSTIASIKYWLSSYLMRFEGQLLDGFVINQLSQLIGNRVGYRLQDISLDAEGKISNVRIVAAWDWKPL